MEDIIELLEYVPPIHHDSYHNLTTDEAAPLQHPYHAGFQTEDKDTQEAD